MDIEAARTYAEISREEFEEFLDSLPWKWSRAPGTAGVYLLDLSDNCAIKVLSSLGGGGRAMGRGRGAMHAMLVSKHTGHNLNKKAQGQQHVARTTNWRQNLRKVIDRVKVAWQRSQGFYEALAVIRDRDAYKRDNILRIEAIPNWRNDGFLSDMHDRLSGGGILTVNQLAALDRAAARQGPRTPQRSAPAPRPAPAPTRAPQQAPAGESHGMDIEHLLPKLRGAWKGADQAGDAKAKRDIEAVAGAVKRNQRLNGRQQSIVRTVLRKYDAAVQSYLRRNPPGRRARLGVVPF